MTDLDILNFRKIDLLNYLEEMGQKMTEDEIDEALDALTKLEILIECEEKKQKDRN